MKVHIEKDLFLESDERSFVIKEYLGKQDKDGNERFKVHGYFGTAQQALKKFLRMKIAESTASTLAELVQEISKIERYIESKVRI